LTTVATLSNGAALPAWLSFNAASGRLSGTPTDKSTGALAIKLTARDMGGLSASTALNLTINADPPPAPGPAPHPPGPPAPPGPTPPPAPTPPGPPTPPTPPGPAHPPANAVANRVGSLSQPIAVVPVSVGDIFAANGGSAASPAGSGSQIGQGLDLYRLWGGDSGNSLTSSVSGGPQSIDVLTLQASVASQDTAGGALLLNTKIADNLVNDLASLTPSSWDQTSFLPGARMGALIAANWH
ncbi:MAG TPA: hypothetical protein HPP80_10610, partial [Rhodospirillaceae bacterium]|nr:hypothetical protein [Rhodospirillaceae bacterium]